MILNVLLIVLGLGFAWCVWLGSLASGPEGPVGAWIALAPFLLLLLGLMTAIILQGRLNWAPGSKPAAFVLLPGLLIAVASALVAAFGPYQSAGDFLLAATPFLAWAGCFWAVNSNSPAPMAKLGILLCLGLPSVLGWSLAGRTLAAHWQQAIENGAEQDARDRADEAARASRDAVEYGALAADAPLIAVIYFEFARNPGVREEARRRIANWPNLDQELSRILNDDHRTISDLTWTIAYIADLHPSPSPLLAPAYGKALEKGYRYWESTMQYDEYAAKSEPEVSQLLHGAERIQRAGGDLRPQLRAWHELIRKTRGFTRVAARLNDLLAQS